MTKTYQIEVTSKHPAYGERPSVLSIEAGTAKEAISKARKQTRYNVGGSRLDGGFNYRNVTNR
jgi:hypothetical protein